MVWKKEVDVGFCGQNQGGNLLLKLSSQSELLYKKKRGNSGCLAYRIFLPKVREGREKVLSEKLN